MLLLPYQGDKDISLTKMLKRDLDKHLPNKVKMQVTFTGQKLNLMLRIGPNLNKNMMLFILVNAQERTVLIITLVNLLEGSLSEL